jgi:hypothetical protein
MLEATAALDEVVLRWGRCFTTPGSSSRNPSLVRRWNRAYRLVEKSSTCSEHGIEAPIGVGIDEGG